MGWVRIDDAFYDHPTMAGLELDAWGLWVWSLAWSNRNLTDGVVHKAVIARMDPSGLVTKALVGSGKWIEADDAIEIHDYLDFQRSAEQIREQSAATAHRAALRNDKALVREIRARDGNRCRYCGRRVDWTDRKSSKGGTYDHVIPMGPNTMENIVVACKGCNSRKGARTPDEAGMPLISVEPPTEGLQTGDGFSPDITGIEPQPPSSEEPSEGSPPKRRDTKTLIPIEFQVTEAMQAWVVEKYPNLNWVLESEKFVASAKANARRYADWEKAWQNWMHTAASGRFG